MNKVRFHKIRVIWSWVAIENIDWNSHKTWMYFFNLYIYASQFCINFCFATWKGMASKTPEEAIVMARNSSQIQEKIQIHFEINFDKCHFILKYICSTWSRHYWDFDIIMTNTGSALNELSLQCWCTAKFCFFLYHLIGVIYWLIDFFFKWSLADRPTD